MKCSDLQFNLSLYADGFLGEAESSAITDHLVVCPLCRQTNADYREIRSDLRRINRPDLSTAFKKKLSESVRAEMFRERRAWLPVSSDVRELLQMRVMPYGVGVFASFVIGITFLTMMFSGMLRPGRMQTVASSGDSSVLLASNSNPFTDVASADFISPSDYARNRLAYSSESPSVNPQGALIALTKSLMRGGMKDDEVVVVADVFGNGLAQVAEVVEPSRDRRAVGELVKALASDPAFSPFVPANMEDRPESVRVVLKFQCVNVSTGTRRNRARL